MFALGCATRINVILVHWYQLPGETACYKLYILLTNCQIKLHALIAHILNELRFGLLGSWYRASHLQTLEFDVEYFLILK